MNEPSPRTALWEEDDYRRTKWKPARTTRRSDASCNVASPREFAFSRTPVPFIPWLSPLKHSRIAAARGTGWSPGSASGSGGMTAPREGARRREDTQGEACGWAHPRSSHVLIRGRPGPPMKNGGVTRLKCRNIYFGFLHCFWKFCFGL